MEFKGHHKNTIHSVGFNSDGRKLASSSIDGDIYVYHVDRDGKLDRATRLSGHVQDVDQIQWSPSSADLLASVSLDKTVKLWDTRSKSALFSLETGTENINVALSDTHIAAASKDDNIHFIDVSSRSVQTIKVDAEVNEIKWSFDGKLLFVSTGMGTIRIYDFASMEVVQELFAHTANTYTIHIDPRSRFIASGGADAIVSLFDYRDLLCINTFTNMEWPIRSVALSSDAELLAIGSEDDHVDIINVLTGKTEHEIETKHATNSISWHPYKRIVAYCSDSRDSGVFVKSFE